MSHRYPDIEKFLEALLVLPRTRRAGNVSGRKVFARRLEPVLGAQSIGPVKSRRCCSRIKIMAAAEGHIS